MHKITKPFRNRSYHVNRVNPVQTIQIVAEHLNATLLC